MRPPFRLELQVRDWESCLSLPLLFTFVSLIRSRVVIRCRPAPWPARRRVSESTRSLAHTRFYSSTAEYTVVRHGYRQE